MDLSKILTISGKYGLFRLITKGKNNFIVESLEDKKRFSAFQSEGISTLDNISIYTHDDALELGKLLQTIYEKQEKQPLDFKEWSDTQLRAYFSEVIPNYDENKVFISNIKKIYLWYNILLKNDLILLEETNIEKDSIENEE